MTDFLRMPDTPANLEPLALILGAVLASPFYVAAGTKGLQWLRKLAQLVLDWTEPFASPAKP